jgi:hypothetical protein
MGRAMRGCCTSLLVAINTVTLCVGLAVLGLSIYLLVEKRTLAAPSGADAWVLVAAAWAPFALGLLITLLALIGCCSALGHNRCCIGIFGIMQLVVGIVLVLCGAAWMVGSDYMGTVSTSAPALLEPGFYGSQHALSDVSSGLFYACCANGVPPANQLKACNAANGVGTSLSSVCYWDYDTFVAPIASARNDQDECQNVIKSGLFTCPPSSAGTSGTAVRQMQASMASYTRTYLWPTGVALVVAGAILLLAFLGSMYLACCAARETYVQQPQYKTGANLAGGPVYSPQPANAVVIV